MEFNEEYFGLNDEIKKHGIDDILITEIVSSKSEKRLRRSAQEVLKIKKDKILKAQKELAALSRALTKKERKERDTALFTAGACLLAAIEGDDPELKRYAIEIWRRVSIAHAPIITDYRRSCLVKTAFINGLGDVRS